MKKKIIYAVLITFIIIVSLFSVFAAPNFDLNGDGSVTVSDISSLAQLYRGKGTYNASYDFNNDSEINLFDIVRLARNISTISQGGSNATYPNLPEGMSLIGSFDGSAKNSSDGSAFGIDDFASWDLGVESTNVNVVDDATNPTGSGKSLRIQWDTNGEGGASSAASFTGGPYDEIYIMARMYFENDTGAWDFGHKIYYVGLDTEDGPTDAYIDTGSPPGRIRFINQNGGSPIEVISSDDPAPKGSNSNPKVLDTWLNIELHMIDESFNGAGDGAVYIWVNGTLMGYDDDITWGPGAGDGFSGMRWYSTTDETVSVDSYQRMGELYIAGK